MFYCPYANNLRDPDPVRPRPNITDAYYRLLHASPDAPPVDVYVSGRLVAPNLRYSHFSNYFKAPAGTYEVKVYPAGTKETPVINTSIRLLPGSIYTAAAIGELKNISLLAIPEPLKGPTPGRAMVRFVHLSPNTPAVDITLPNGNKLFTNVAYKGITNYIPLHPGNYTLQARPTGTDKVALYIPNIHLLPNRIYTIYAVGLLNGKPPLQVLIPLDGSTYL